MNLITQQLRDIHLPPAIPIWPFAPGWYVLAFMIAMLIIGIIFLISKKWRRFHKQKKIFKELQILQQNYATHPQQSLEDISILMRRISLAFSGRSKTAGLTGENWLHFLDQTGVTDQFTKGIGRVLINAPYAKQTDVDIDALIELIQVWIKKTLL